MPRLTRTPRFEQATTDPFSAAPPDQAPFGQPFGPCPRTIFARDSSCERGGAGRLEMTATSDGYVLRRPAIRRTPQGRAPLPGRQPILGSAATRRDRRRPRVGPRRTSLTFSGTPGTAQPQRSSGCNEPTVGRMPILASVPGWRGVTNRPAGTKPSTRSALFAASRWTG